MSDKDLESTSCHEQLNISVKKFSQDIDNVEFKYDVFHKNITPIALDMPVFSPRCGNLNSRFMEALMRSNKRATMFIAPTNQLVLAPKHEEAIAIKEQQDSVCATTMDKFMTSFSTSLNSSMDHNTKKASVNWTHLTGYIDSIRACGYTNRNSIFEHNLKERGFKVTYSGFDDKYVHVEY
jgi:hypothetical protein